MLTNITNKKKVIETLGDDNDYYGVFGKNYFSQSDIKVLCQNPAAFKGGGLETKELLMGKYFHQLMLEPEKSADFPVLNVSSRNTKAYKEALEHNNFKMIMLEHEKQSVEEWVSAMKRNLKIYDLIYDDNNRFEVPEVKIINGYAFKGKADIISNDYVIDLKTTSNVHDFPWSVRKYYYDVQGYIYRELFDKPIMFISIDKNTHMMAKDTLNENSYEQGRIKLQKGLENYEKFFGKNSVENAEDYVIEREI